jgi:hypothetical protein
VRRTDEPYSGIRTRDVCDDRRSGVGAAVVHDYHFGVDAQAIELCLNLRHGVRNACCFVVRGHHDRKEYGLPLEAEGTIGTPPTNTVERSSVVP